MRTQVNGERVLDQLVEVGQNLGAAAWLGGQLFATVGLHPAVEVLADPGERTGVIDEAWRRYRPYGSGGLWIAQAATVVRTYRALRRGDGQTALAALNFACAAGAVGAASVSGYLGKEIARATPGGRTPITTATEPADETPARARQAQRWLAVSEGLALAFGVGLVVTSALLTADQPRPLAGGHPVTDRMSMPRVPEFGTGRPIDLAASHVPPFAVSPTAGRGSSLLPEIAG